MKKFTLLIFFCVLGMMPTMAQKLKLESSKAYNIKHKFEIVSQGESAEEALSRKKAARKLPTPDAGGFYTKASGECYAYSMDNYFDLGFGTSAQGGLLTEVWYDKDDGNTVYIQDLVHSYGDGNYAVGQLTGDMQNGEITFKSGQALSTFSSSILYVMPMYLDSDGYYDVDTDAEDFTFVIKDGVIDADGTVLGLVTSEGSVYAAEAYTTITPFDAETNVAPVIPDDAQAYYYNLDSSKGNDAIIYRSGNDFYFKGLFDSKIIRGTLNDDNKIAFTTPQYVGIRESIILGDAYQYFNTAYVDEDNYIHPDKAGTVLFDYDPSTGSIEAPDDRYLFLFNGINVEISEYVEPGAVWTLLDSSEQPVTLPDDAKLQTYALESEHNGLGYHQGALVEATIYNDSVLYIARPDAKTDALLLKASIDKKEYDPSSNIIPFALNVGQIVGYVDNSLIKIYSGQETVKEIDDEDWGSYTTLVYSIDPDINTVNFRYDKTTRTITTDDILFFATRSGSGYNYVFYPTLTAVDNITASHDCADQVLIYTEGKAQAAKLASMDQQADTIWITLPASDEYVSGRAGLPAMTFKGTVDGDKLTIAVPQLVSDDPEGFFLRNGELIDVNSELEGYEDYSWKEWSDYGAKTVTCDYDATTGKIVFPDHLSIMGLYTLTTYDEDYNDVPLCDLSKQIAVKYENRLYTPAAPYDLSIKDPSEDYWGKNTRWCLTAYIPNLDVEGIWLDYDSITFRLYFDDEPFVFEPDVYYPDFSEPTIDVPFNNPASRNIPHPYFSDYARMIYLNSIPEHKLGVQSTYHYCGETADSEITWLDVEGLNGIVGISSKASATTEWFDLTGRKIDQPTKGINIQRCRFSDGSTTTKKIIVK